MARLQAKQKEAVAALITELFNAENILELKKIRLLNQKLQEYGISARAIKEAKCMSLENAVSTISSIEDLCIKKKIIDDLEEIARKDGYCSPAEAILLQSLKIALLPAAGKTSVDGLIFSMRPNKLNFDGRKVTYIHPDKNLVSESEKEIIDMYADKIMRHLDELVLLFYCFGYDFVYIPKLREDYGRNPGLQEELKNFSFFFSNLPKESIESAIAAFGVLDDSRMFSTAKFAKMLFSGRENDVPSDHNSPAFLIKISDSFIIDDNYVHNGRKETKYKKMYNFLYLPIVANGISGIIDTAKNFFQEYVDIVDQSAYIVQPESSKRLRHFDLYQSLIARIAKEGIVKSSPRLILDLTYEDNETLIFEKAINGNDVIISIKSYITEYMFALWCSANANELERMDSTELRAAAKDVWEFIDSELNGDHAKADYQSFKDNFSRSCYNIGQSFKRKKLPQYVTNINDYIPIKINTKEDGPMFYRIATRDIEVVEKNKGTICRQSLENSDILQRINNYFFEDGDKNDLDIQI